MPLNQQDLIPFGSVADGFNNSAQEMLEARSLGRGRPLTELAAPFEVRAPGDGKIYQRNGADNGWDFIGFESQPYWGAPRPGIFIEGFELAYGDYPNNTFASNKLFSVKPGRIFISGDGPIAKLTNGVIEYYPEVEQDFLRKRVDNTAAWVPGQGQPGAYVDPTQLFATGNPCLTISNPFVGVFLLISETTGALDVTYGAVGKNPLLMPASDRILTSFEVSDFVVDTPAAIANGAGGPWRIVCRLGYLPIFDVPSGDYGIYSFYQNGNKSDLLGQNAADRHVFNQNALGIKVYDAASVPASAGGVSDTITVTAPPNSNVDLRLTLNNYAAMATHKLFTNYKNISATNTFTTTLLSPPGGTLIWESPMPNGASYALDLSLRSSILSLQDQIILQHTTVVSSFIAGYLTVSTGYDSNNDQVQKTINVKSWDDYTLPRIPFRVNTI